MSAELFVLAALPEPSMVLLATSEEKLALKDLTLLFNHYHYHYYYYLRA